MKKAFVILIVLAVLGYGGFYGYQKWQKQQHQTKLAQMPKTAKVESRDIRFAVTAAGDIGPADQVSVRPEVNGRIAELPVDIGDQVKKGDLLCRLDDADLQIERSSRLTEIEGAKLQLEKAKRTFERTKDLYEQKLVAKEIYDDAKTDFDLASNNLERADKNLKLVEDRLSKTKIMAPFDCTVLVRPVSIGQAVSGSGGFNSGTEVMTIANLNDMIITAHISQADVTRLQPNQEVNIELDSVPGLKMKGEMERIAPQATVKNNLKGFSARISIKDIDPRVRPGMTANLSIPIDLAEGVLAIPLGAVFTEKGERFVYVKKGASFERRPIKIGISDYNYAEVTQGLSDGDSVSLQQPEDATEGKGGDKRMGKNRPGGGSGGQRPGGTNSTPSAGGGSSTTPRRPTL
jgi:RND family efflux transporter MFP subunit